MCLFYIYKHIHLYIYKHIHLHDMGLGKTKRRKTLTIYMNIYLNAITYYLKYVILTIYCNDILYTFTNN